MTTDVPHSRLAVVIPLYNGEAFVARLLESLAAQSRPPDVVFLVDNKSTDGGAERAAALQPAIRVIGLEKNFGFSVACNAGITAALEFGADFIFLLNQDTILDEHTLRELLGAMSDDERLGYLVPFQLRYNGTGIDPIFRGCLPAEWFDDLYFGRTATLYRAPFLPAAATLLRSEALAEVGGFDPLFFMYKEDKDLCRRLTVANWAVGLAPRALLYHHCGQANAIRTWRWHLNWLYSEAIFDLKWSPDRWPRPLFALARRALGIPRPGTIVLHLMALCLCLPKLRQIARARRGTVDRPSAEADRGRPSKLVKPALPSADLSLVRDP